MPKVSTGANGLAGELQPPLVFEQCIKQLFVPLALDEHVLAEMCFPAHAEPLHHAPGSFVERMAAGIDAMYPGAVEGERHERPPRFRRKAASMRIGMEDVADLRLPVLGTAQDQRHLADHRIVVAPLDGKEDL